MRPAEGIGSVVVSHCYSTVYSAGMDGLLSLVEYILNCFILFQMADESLL